MGTLMIPTSLRTPASSNGTKSAILGAHPRDPDRSPFCIFLPDKQPDVDRRFCSQLDGFGEDRCVRRAKDGVDERLPELGPLFLPTAPINSDYHSDKLLSATKVGVGATEPLFV